MSGDVIQNHKGQPSQTCVQQLCSWRIPNLYSEAKELVCGGSPIVCVLIERKAQLKVGAAAAQNQLGAAACTTQVYSHG